MSLERAMSSEQGNLNELELPNEDSNLQIVWLREREE